MDRGHAEPWPRHPHPAPGTRRETGTRARRCLCEGCAAAGAVEGLASVAGGEDCADDGIGDSGLFEDIECCGGCAASAGDAGAEVGGRIV